MCATCTNPLIYPLPRTTLSVPSVVFAEAGWYGSLRSGLQFGGGEDGKLVDAYSRFGIKGSNEVSDGLSAVYRFETKINTTNANLDGGRLSYVGLSGGFGTITIGQIWGASYNHAGAVFDLANYGGGHNTSGRVGNALSYSISTGSVSAQIDAIMDGGTDSSGGGIDQFEFGLSFDMGDIGKIALAHRNVRDKLSPATLWAGPEDDRVEVKPITVYLTGALNVAANVADGVLTDAGLLLIERTGTRYHTDGALAAQCKTLLDDDAATTDDCVTVKAYVSEKSSARRAAGAPADQATTTTVTETFYAEADSARLVDPMNVGHKTTNLAVQFNLGAITAHLGASQIKKTNMAKKTKVTHFGLNGGLGDTGMSFYAAGRSIKPADSMEMKSTPWVVGLNRSLGDGAKVWLEHENLDNGKSGITTVGLNVNF